MTETNDREWAEHQQDHSREHRVAEDTARRLEREVEQTAIRLQAGVQTALVAVAETAKVHSEAHNREHLAHERIHAVEKTQVDKAERAMNARLEAMNEFRSALNDQASRMITREIFETYQKEREARLQAAIDRIISLEKTQVSGDRVDAVQSDSRRQRNGFLVAVALLTLGVVINLVVNLLQVPAVPGVVP